MISSKRSTSQAGRQRFFPGEAVENFSVATTGGVFYDGGMRTNRTVPVLVAVFLAGAFFPSLGEAELVKRPMYVNSSGKTVSQYVFQAGNSRFTERSRGVTYGYGFGQTYYGYHYPVHYRQHYRPVHHGRPHGGHVHGSISGGRLNVKIRY